ncbi:MAG: insulinase family protein [Pirellulaceae bacterium]|nr:insulinase family protein [Pirellulaceae bacterium]
MDSSFCRKWLVTLMLLFTLPIGAVAAKPQRVAEVEGITEYRLENGLRLLLYPDPSRPTVTVSLTVLVGSRHEGAGEGGMAHLLEHMLFKGTPTHENIPQLLQERGASFNGTTNADRTNYFETLPASDENLEFAIRLEADRMMNSRVRGEDLASEMTVVRNEFERSENSPFSVLNQKMMSAAYQWHNYGRATIGNRSDIERVPLPKLREFYRKYYQPDNAMLVVAGSFDAERALELVQKYFGAIPRPERELSGTYTEEPPQDGERLVTLRRVGEVGVTSVLYHVPAASHPDFAALSVLAGILGDPPSGRLYKGLVETKLATDVGGGAFARHDPTVIGFSASVPDPQNLETVRERLLEIIEGVVQVPVTSDEVERARQRILKNRELSLSDTSRIAVSLSSWEAQGDWRLFFLFRDAIEAVTPEDVQRVAAAYLRRNNRTVGLYVPSETTERVEIPATPDIEQLVKDYRGREQVAEGERFDPSPLAIEARVQRFQLDGGPQIAMLPKKTRGRNVHLELTLRYGNEDSLRGRREAMAVLPSLMMRGTKNLSREQLQDALDRQRTRLQASGGPGEVTFSLETQADYLPAALDLLRQVVREPSFPPGEFELVRQAQIASLEQASAEPEALAGIRLDQLLEPYAKDDVRYVPSIPERLEAYRALTRDQVAELYAEFVGAQHAQLSVVGDVDGQQLRPLLAGMLADWQAPQPYARITRTASTRVAGARHVVATPDKANAVYNAGLEIAISDRNPQYPALMLGNWVLGSSGLSSRLGDRVRQQEGLSYSVRSQLAASPFDERARFGAYAIANPANMDRVVQVVAEELERLLKDGVTSDELERARQGYLQRQELARSNEQYLVGLLNRNLYAGRTMQYHAELEDRVREATAEQVVAALREYLDVKRLVVVTAGDFARQQTP